ncbi:PREDICTED: polyadenylate-binding protein 3 [Populus euphratica]|uniref:Polyadenylate-binding protein n=1 Tax=Populus euphratica TaxID=75702 RepID=A0AAJ6UBF9_POPEU|nr:PREDICTED: polyadenylate-binding protein 3 [Populus euphratica]
MAAAVAVPVVTDQTAAVVAPAAETTAAEQFPNRSLYVGDLEHNVKEGQLFDLFSQVAPVVSTRVCRDQAGLTSLGYAYVNFSNPQDAAKAMEVLNFTPLNGKPIRIMFSHRDPTTRRSGHANVFIKNLDTKIDNKALHETFASFGPVLSCKVAVDNNGQSKGYGFIQFENEEDAQSAINRLNGMLVNDREVYVGPFVRRLERIEANGSPKFTNVYVKNLSETTSDEDLKKIFSSYGAITSAIVMKDQNGKSRGFGFVNFQSPDSAAAAVEKLNGMTFSDKVWYVGRAQRKGEREAELKAKFEQERNSRYEKMKAANLYLKNLGDTIDEERLKELFSEFGSITSCKVMVDQQGLSKGSGFVAFSTPEEASRALSEMNGKMIGKKPLYVAIAQRREERMARLQAHFSQIQAPGLPALPSGLPGYHPGTPRLAPHQLYFGQGTPGMMPPQPAGYSFQPQLLPGMRAAVGPNFVMPYQLQRQGQQGQRIGMRPGGNHQQMQQQQLLHRNTNQGLRYVGNARNGIDSSVVPQGFVGPVMPLSFEASGMPVTPGHAQPTTPVPISTLTTALASATPENRMMMLGEQLYPLVECLEPDHAAKVTGMLLEMDQTEVLHLIESPDALKKKVAEAMQVLQEAGASSVGDQPGSLALNE